MSKLFKRPGNAVWYAWVPKPGGGVRRVSTRCTDKRAAETALRQLERDAVDPAGAAARQTYTATILDDYARSRAMMGRSEATLRYVAQKGGVLIQMLPMHARDLTHATLSRYVEQRLAQGAMRTTVKKELGVLAPALRLAKKNGKWHGDPEAVIPQLDDDYEPRKRALTPWELVALCSTLEDGRAAHVAFIVATGARWGESLRAELQDVDGHLVRLRGTKTKRAARVVPVPPALRGVLAWAVAESRVFVSGAMFERWPNVRRDLAVACRQLGIEAVTPNDLRRTFGTWLRVWGAHPSLIGDAMGHVDSRMAERVYARLSPADLGNLLEQQTSGTGSQEAPAADRWVTASPVGSPDETGTDSGERCAVTSEDVEGGARPLPGEPHRSLALPPPAVPAEGGASSPVRERYVCCAPVVAATLAALNALHGPSQPRVIAGIDGAQGQNRTGDTRIFNPGADDSHVRVTADDSTDTAHVVGHRSAVDWSQAAPVAGRERGICAWWAPGIDPSALEFGPLHGTRAPFPLRAAADALAARGA